MPITSTVEQLLDGIKRLAPQELIEFEEKFFEIKQQRIASLADEKVLQQQIAYRFPEKKKQRMRVLLYKNNAGTITQAEKFELDELIEEFEQKSLEKAEAMYLLTHQYKKEFIEGLDSALEEVSKKQTKPVKNFDDFVL